jgi:hypothetical protein
VTTLDEPRPVRSRRGVLVAALVLAVVAAGVVVWLLVRGGDGERVSVFPGPTTLAASPTTTITLRGEDVDVEGATVTGVQRGEYAGRWKEHPDGGGATFTPAKPFAPGDRVSLETDDVRSAFVVAREGTIPKPPFDEGKPEADDGIQRFASRPDLRPPEVVVESSTPGASDGGVFVAPKRGPTQEGPMILDGDGKLVWFSPVEGDQQAFDFRVQQYRGKDVLTWWQGAVALYRGSGSGRIMDSSYRQIAEVRAANGYEMDAHEFQLTPAGTALIMAYVPVPWDTSSVGGRRDGIVEDCVIQEIDVATGTLLFEWHALGAIGLGESYRPAPKKAGQFHDPYHFNSVGLDAAGDFLVSARHTSAVYKIDRETGKILWRLGGKRSDFAMGPGTKFNLQHDARVQPNGTISLFDNVAEDLPARGRVSRGLVLRVDEQARRASVAREYERPRTLSPTQGSMEVMDGERAFVGWGGSRREFTEFSAPGSIAWDARFVPKDVESYRAYRMPWSGRPSTPPDALLRDGVVSASWNGATDVTAWRVTPAGGEPVEAPRSGFETTVQVPGRPRTALVEALNASGEVLGQSEAFATG